MPMLPPRIAAAMVALAFVAGSIMTPPVRAANTPRPPDPCNKELSVDDVQGILNGKATINHYSMSESNAGEGCSIGVAGNGTAFVDISIRQGDLQSFKNLIFFASSRKPVAGIGDEAFATPTTDSNVPNSKETDLYARKGNLQCIAQLHRSNGNGEKLVVPATDAAIVAKLGGLCTKLFAARGAK
jgi:hypothetical protein